MSSPSFAGPSGNKSRPGPASKRQPKGTKRCRNEEDDEDDLSPRPVEITFMGSYQWNIQDYNAAVQYMDTAKTQLQSATFYLKNGIIFGSGANRHDETSHADGVIAFQIRARLCTSDDLCLKLFCGWGQAENGQTPCGRGDNAIEVVDEESEDHLTARYSFSVETPRGPPLRESSGNYHERLSRRELTRAGTSSGDSWSELHPLKNRFRCMNARAPSAGQDLIVNVDYKVVLHKFSGTGSVRNKCRRTAMLDRLYNSKDYSDITLVSAGGHRFPAHKLMLSARSSVFATMFSHPEMAENRTNEVKMDDARPEVIQRILLFIYKDKFQVDDEDGDTVAQGMLEAAEKYDIQDLKAECELFLCSKLNASNAGHLLLLADFHGANRLKSAAIDYMSGKMKQLVETTVFNDIIGNKQLTKELFKAMAEKMES